MIIFPSISLMILSVAVPQAVQETEPAETVSPEQVADFSQLLSVYKTICYETNMLPDLVFAAAENSGFALEEQPARVGARWTSGPEYNASYITPGAVAAIPTPQCNMSLIAESAGEHLSLVSDVEKSLAITGAKSSGSRGSFRTGWDVQNVDGSKMRMFFKSRPASGGKVKYDLSLIAVKSVDTNLTESTE